MKPSRLARRTQARLAALGRPTPAGHRRAPDSLSLPASWRLKFVPQFKRLWDMPHVSVSRTKRAKTTTPTSAPVSRSGRFAGGPAADVAQFTESISFDWRLWRHDIPGSMAHATMLRQIGVLTAAEARPSSKGWTPLRRKSRPGNSRGRRNMEDVHMNIESALTRRVPAGAKLHTARSRNDQVALDMRLWLRDEITRPGRGHRRACNAPWSAWAKRMPDVIIPGYTHLQRAQPVYLAHHLLAYVEMLAARPRPAARTPWCG